MIMLEKKVDVTRKIDSSLSRPGTDQTSLESLIFHACCCRKNVIDPSLHFPITGVVFNNTIDSEFFHFFYLIVK